MLDNFRHVGHACLRTLSRDVRWSVVLAKTALPATYVMFLKSRHGHSGYATLSDAKLVDFRLSPRQAEDAVSRNRTWLQKNPEIENMRAVFMPFFFFDVHSTWSARAQVGYDYTTRTYDAFRKQWVTETRTEWRIPTHDWVGRGDFPASDRAVSQVYAGLRHERPYVQAVKLSNALQLAHPFNPSYIANKKREIEPFEVYKTRAWEMVIQRVQRLSQQEAEKAIKRDTNCDRVAGLTVDVHVTYSSSHAVYLPAYVLEWAHAGYLFKTFVSGESGAVGGENVYSETKVGLLAAAAASFWHVLAYYPHGTAPMMQKVLSVLGTSGFITQVGTLGFLCGFGARFLPVMSLVWKVRQRQSEILANTLHSSRQQTGWETHTGRANWGFGEEWREAWRRAEQAAGGAWGQAGGRREEGRGAWGWADESSHRRERRQEEARGSARARAGGDPLGYYAALGVKQSASVDEIKTAYRKKAMECHPDMVPAEKKAKASEEFKKLTEAYQVLRDASKRTAYDQGRPV